MCRQRDDPDLSSLTVGVIYVSFRCLSAWLCVVLCFCFFFFFQAEDGIRDWSVTGVQTCALPISTKAPKNRVAVFVRDSATRFFGALVASDRVSLNTTSGQLTQDFTDDHEKLSKALLGILPRPVTGQGFHDCPDVGYYQADLIVNKSDVQALAVATEDALQCAFNGDTRMMAAAQSLAQAAADRAVSQGDNETQYAYRHLEDVVRRLANMPGQRVLVLVSPGFITTTLQSEASEMVDRATRANIVINTIDARGLYAPDVMGDIADPSIDTIRTAGNKASYPA